MNPPGLSQSQVKPRPALAGRSSMPMFVSPMAECLFGAASVQGVKARQRKTISRTCLHDAVEHMQREFGRNVDLPAQLADIGDTAGAHDGVADLDLLRSVPNGKSPSLPPVSAPLSSASSDAREFGPISPTIGMPEVTSVTVQN